MDLFWIITLVVIFIICAYVLSSLHEIQAHEKAVLFFLGEAKKVKGPGWRLCLYPFCSIRRFDMKPLTFFIKVPTAVTKNGLVKGYKDGGEEFERVELDIYIVLVLFFKDDDLGLLETVKRTTGNDAASLGSVIAPYVIDVVRSTFSEMPWPLSYQDRKKVADYMLAKIIPRQRYHGLIVEESGKSNMYYFDDKIKIGPSEKSMSRYNPIVQLNLDTTKATLNIKDINFSHRDLSVSLNAAENARLNSESIRISDDRSIAQAQKRGEAEVEIEKKKNNVALERAKGEASIRVEEKKEAGLVEAELIQKKGVAEADAREKMVAVIKDNVDLEMLKTLEKMANGTSNTIMFQIPAAIEARISSILGGNKPAEFLKLLQDKEVLQLLQEQILKIQK